MHTENNKSNFCFAGGFSGKKLLKVILILIAAVVVVVILAVPAYISSGSGKSLILGKINSAVSGKVSFDTLSMGWLRGIRLTEFNFADKTGGTSISVKSISTRPYYGSLLTGRLAFGRTVIEQPRISVTVPAVAKEAAIPAEKAEAKKAAAVPVILPVERIDLVVSDGDVKVNSAAGRTLELKNINTQVSLRPAGESTTFDLALAVAGGGEAKDSNISVVGEVKPSAKKGWSLEGTSGDVTIEVNELDLASLAPLFAILNADVRAAGKINVDIAAGLENGQLEKMKGEILGEGLDIGAGGATADRIRTGSLIVDVNMQSREDVIEIEKMNVKADWMNVSLAGSMPRKMDALGDFLGPESKHTLKGDFYVDVAAVMSMMPQTFGKKEGMTITGGKLNGNIDTFTEGGQRAIIANATLAGLAALTDGRTVGLSQPITMSAKILADKGGAKIETLGVTSSFAKIGVSGTTEALDYLCDADLGAMQSEIGQFVDFGGYKLAGVVHQKGNISIKKPQIASSGSWSITNLTVTSAKGVATEPEAKIDYSLNADTDKGVLKIDSLNLAASVGKVSVAEAVLPMNANAKQPLKLTAEAGIDLQKVQPFGVVLASFPPQMKMAGKLDSKVSLEEEVGSYRIFTDSTKIRNLKIDYPGKAPFEQAEISLAVDARVNPKEQTIAVKKLQLISPQINIKKGELSQTTMGGITKLSAELDTEYDLAAVSSAAAAFLPAGLQIKGKRQDSISINSEYPQAQTNGLMANMNAKAGFGFDEMQYKGLNVGKTEMNVQVQKGLLTIAPFSAPVNGGKLNFAAGADFNAKPTILRVAGPMQIIENVQLNDVMGQMLLMYVNPIFARAVNVTGVANFNCEKMEIPIVEGSMDRDLAVTGTIDVSNMRLQGSDLVGQLVTVLGSGGNAEMAILPTRFVLQNGVLTYENMQVNIGQNPVNFKGSLGLDKKMNMTVVLPFKTGGAEGARVELPLEGTVDNPKINVGKLVEKQAEQQLKQQLQKGLEQIFK